MATIAAIVVGIGAYRYDRAQFPVLEFAAKDADEFIRYLRTCWPKTGDIYLTHIPENEASIQEIEEAFASSHEHEPFDLQLVYLSGHGFVDDANAGFLLQPSPGSTEISLLVASHLDTMLSSTRADRTVLILDCCYAEAITKSMTFFHALGQSHARLFVASSREDQLTWEDQRVGHGIFTAHFIDLLMTGSSLKLKGVRDRLDVDSELFPVLCDQVPLYVFEHKRQRQEPVKGGVSTSPVTFPVARAAKRIKERTAFGSALRRLRQIVAGVAFGCVVFLLFAYGLAYYAQADRNGNIRLHYGSKWLAPAFRVFPSLRVETEIASSELSIDPADRYSIQSGEIWGFWTQLSRSGYRNWYDAVRPSLDQVQAFRYDVLIGAKDGNAVDLLNDQSRPSQVATAAWALLDHADQRQLKTLFGHVLGADRTSPLLVPFSTGDMDFNILDLTQPELGSYADALRSTAAIDPDQTFLPYLGFLKATQLWIANSSSEQHGLEAQRRAAEDVSDLLAVIVKARKDRGEPGLDQNMTEQLEGLGSIGYGDLVRLAMARVSISSADKLSEARKALSAFHGHSQEKSEAIALRKLKDSLSPSDESKQIVVDVYQRFVTAGGPEQADLTGFLIVAAEKKSLPPSVINILLKSAREAVERHDGRFLDSEYARILAHAMGQIPPESRTTVYQLISQVTSGVTPVASSSAEMYLALGKQRLETPEMYRQIVTIAKAAPPYKPESPAFVAEPLPGMSIVVGHGPWLEALAVLAADRPISPEETQILANHADDPSVHDEIITALAAQKGFMGGECWTTSCSKQLGLYTTDAHLRAVAADVIAKRLAMLTRGDFDTALSKLKTERDLETEPEVRIAIGRARINAQAARVQTVPVGNALFE